MTSVSVMSFKRSWTLAASHQVPVRKPPGTGMVVQWVRLLPAMPGFHFTVAAQPPVQAPTDAPEKEENDHPRIWGSATLRGDPGGAPGS